MDSVYINSLIYPLHCRSYPLDKQDNSFRYSWGDPFSCLIFSFLSEFIPESHFIRLEDQRSEKDCEGRLNEIEVLLKIKLFFY